MDGEHKCNRLGAEVLQRWKFLVAVGTTCIAHQAIDGSHHFRRLCIAFWDACCPFPRGHLDFAYCGLFSRYFQKCHGCQLRPVSVMSLYSRETSLRFLGLPVGLYPSGLGVRPVEGQSLSSGVPNLGFDSTSSVLTGGSGDERNINSPGTGSPLDCPSSPVNRGG